MIDADTLNKKRFIGEAGAGLVKITINITGVVYNVEIDDLIFTKTDKQLISDLFAAAMNNAYEKADAELKLYYAKQMAASASLYNLPVDDKLKN